MAVRFDATTDYLERTNVPVPVSVCGWARLSVDRNDYTVLYFADVNAVGSASGPSYGMVTDSDGTTLKHWNGSVFGSSSRTLTVGDWIFWAWTVAGDGTTATWYHAAIDDATLTSEGATLTGSADGLRHHVGNDPFANFWDGVVHVKALWNVVLTSTELEHERWTRRPQRWSDLYLWSPMWAGASERAKDYSGNGRDWTEGGTLTDEDHPPVSWGAPLRGSGWPVSGAAPTTIKTRQSLLGVGI